jgi:hypothetical protein
MRPLMFGMMGWWKMDLLWSSLKIGHPLYPLCFQPLALRVKPLISCSSIHAIMVVKLSQRHSHASYLGCSAATWSPGDACALERAMRITFVSAVTRNGKSPPFLRVAYPKLPVYLRFWPRLHPTSVRKVGISPGRKFSFTGV